MSACPSCKKKGIEVEKITVANHAKESCWPLGDEQYSICENPGCEVVYYTGSGSRVLRKGDVKTEVTFKEKNSPLCYCKQVTEDDVIRAIENGANTFEEVRLATDIGGGGHCMVTNPAGRCYSRHYKTFIERELAKKGKGCTGSGDFPIKIG